MRSASRLWPIALTAWAMLVACGGGATPDGRTLGSSHRGSSAATVPSARSLEEALAEGAWPEVIAIAAARGESDETVSAVTRAADQADRSTLVAAMQRLPEGSFVAALIHFRLGLLAEHTGAKGEARAHYHAVTGPFAGQAKERLGALGPTSTRSAPSIAILLPLSGPHGGIGRELRSAIEIAAREGGPKRVYLDTAGDPDRAAAQVDEAALKHNAIAILGPVGDRESRAAAARAAERGIPIGLLGPGAETPEPGVFRLVTSPVWEARAAAKTAELLGYKTAAVLAPRDEHGDAAAAAFSRTASALGIRMVSEGRYDPTATNLEDDLKKFLGLDPAKNARLRRHLRRYGTRKGWKTFSPDVPFDLLYIPDEHKRASLVASYLPYFSIEVRNRDLMNAYDLRRKHGGRLPSVVQLLGPSSWHHPTLIPAGGRAVEGALILASFVGGGDEDYAYEEAARFGEAYQRAVGSSPSSFAAQVFDAATLMFRALRSVRSRKRATALLRRARLLAGACGPARIGPSRIIERSPVVLRVEGGSFVLHDF